MAGVRIHCVLPTPVTLQDWHGAIEGSVDNDLDNMDWQLTCSANRTLLRKRSMKQYAISRLNSRDKRMS